MGRQRKFGWCLALWFGLSACQGLNGESDTIDRWTFGRFGWTIFSNPETPGLKEVHLSSGSRVGSMVVVSGSVTEVSEHGTFLVLSDEAARLLVVLTDLDQEGVELPAKLGATLRVLGTVTNGKKGLPLLRAIAIRAGSDTGSHPQPPRA